MGPWICITGISWGTSVSDDVHHRPARRRVQRGATPWQCQCCSATYTSTTSGAGPLLGGANWRGYLLMAEIFFFAQQKKWWWWKNCGIKLGDCWWCFYFFWCRFCKCKVVMFPCISTSNCDHERILLEEPRVGQDLFTVSFICNRLGLAVCLQETFLLRLNWLNWWIFWV